MNISETKTTKAALVIFFAFAAGCMFGCGADNINDGLDRRAVYAGEPGLDAITIYFASENGYMVPMTYTMSKPCSKKEAVKAAVQALIEGPKDNLLKHTLPENTKLKNWCVCENTAYLDFTESFLRLNRAEIVVNALNSLCLTLGDLPSIENVQILVEGEVVKQIAGIDTAQPLVREYENYSGKEAPENVYRVYYADWNGVHLVPITYDSNAASAAGAAREALLKLAAGPQELSLTRTVWPGTQLRDLKIDDGTAEVTFSEEAAGYGGGAGAEKLFVRSVLLTLGQFPEVAEVLISIEGEDGEEIGTLPEGTVIKQPLIPPKYANLADGREV